MTYEPQEGIDYLVNLYEIAGVEPETPPDDIKHALNQRAKEYHPDRLQGLAPEFIEKGERISRLLGRAREILLNPDKREEYDGILSEWKGPISTDGRPHITVERRIEVAIRDLPPEVVEEIAGDYLANMKAFTGYTSNKQKAIETMLTAAGDTAPEELKYLYDGALIERDVMLAAEKAQRAQIIGLTNLTGSEDTATLEHGEIISKQLETAKDGLAEHVERQALGGVSTQLALLAGEEVPVTSAAELAAPIETAANVIAVFDAQAEKIKAIADERQKILDIRYKNYTPEYPEAELQVKFEEHLALGLVTPDGNHWFGFKLSPDGVSADAYDFDDATLKLLEDGNYKAVIEQEIGVMIVKPMESVDVGEQLGVAIAKYGARYKEK